MKKIAIILGCAVILAGTMVFQGMAQGGFDEYGYNTRARVFVGNGESWAMGKLGYTHEQAEAYMGPYAHDRLVMKWNAEWDRGNAEGWSNPPYAAWCTNQWNGMSGVEWQGGVTEGSGETWHYKNIWIGPQGQPDGTPLPDGGYIIWGQFEVIMSHGTFDGEHFWDALAKPAGLVRPSIGK